MQFAGISACTPFLIKNKYSGTANKINIAKSFSPVALGGEAGEKKGHLGEGGIGEGGVL